MLKIILPVLVLLGGIAGAWAIIANRPQLEPQAPQNELPLATVFRTEPRSVWLNVHSQGVVVPRNAIDLVPEVAGKVIRIHPSFVAGGFFRDGEVLVTIDSRNYDYAVADTQARIAEAKRQVASEEAQADQARSEWKALGEGQPTPLALHEPQLAEARARLKAANADSAKARLQRSRCEIRAPFIGRVHDKRIGLGQSIQPGEKLAHLYSTDAAEIRLPVSTDQLGFIDLPLGRNSEQSEKGPKVILSAEFAGATHRWEGRIVRTEGVIDEATGLLHAVAEVRDPYSQERDRPPLLPGLFVQAEIEGRERPGLFVLPQGAINASREVLLVDDDERLHIRRLEVLRTEPDHILIKGGLAPGDRVVIAGITVPVEGMKVRVEEAQFNPSSSTNLP
ncbi:MAG: efflux RND transporter periplasmic adaptor subunit [Methylococcales bacterium]